MAKEDMKTSIEDAISTSEVEKQYAEMDRREAVEAALQALDASATLSSREKLAETLPADGLIDLGNEQIVSSADFVQEAVDTVEKTSRRAARKLSRAGLTEDDEIVKEGMRRYLIQRLGQLENEYAGHKRKLAEREETLAITDPALSLSEEESVTMQAQIDDHNRAMEIISSAWEEAKIKLSELKSGSTEAGSTEAGSTEAGSTESGA